MNQGANSPPLVKLFFMPEEVQEIKHVVSQQAMDEVNSLLDKLNMALAASKQILENIAKANHLS